MTSPLYGTDGDNVRYPIGPLDPKRSLTPQERNADVARIASAPRALRDAVQGLSDAELDEPYREGGWTIRQVVHHLADSHLNAYCRLKLSLTEENPTIKPYDEAKWAELPDSRLPVEVSLVLLDSVHERFVALLRSLKENEAKRTFYHPDHKRSLSVDELISMYAWHGDHHVAHITRARGKRG